MLISGVAFARGYSNNVIVLDTFICHFDWGIVLISFIKHFLVQVGILHFICRLRKRNHFLQWNLEEIKGISKLDSLFPCWTLTFYPQSFWFSAVHNLTAAYPIHPHPLTRIHIPTPSYSQALDQCTPIFDVLSMQIAHQGTSHLLKSCEAVCYISCYPSPTSHNYVWLYSSHTQNQNPIFIICYVVDIREIHIAVSLLDAEFHVIVSIP